MKSKQESFALVFGLNALLLLSLSSVKPVFAQSQMLSVASLLNRDGTINTTAGVNGALDLRGWNVTLDSKLGPILTPLQEPLTTSAASPTDEWWALPHKGLDNTVYAMAVIGNDVYVGGYMTQTFDHVVTVRGIAKFNTINQVWSDMNAHLYTVFEDGCIEAPAAVFALAVNGVSLYVGGNFGNDTDCFSLTPNRIAKFNTNTNTWADLAHKGLNGEVDALAVSGTDVFIGGKFTTTDDNALALSHIAQYDGANWGGLPNNGLNGTVYALTMGGNDLYVGGAFTETADGVLGRHHIAELSLSGGNWVLVSHQGLNDDVFALAADGSDLYVGGLFTQSYDGVVTNLNSIAKFDTSGNSWSALPHNGLNGAVLAIYVDPPPVPCPTCYSTVYIGGAFTRTADSLVTNLNHIAKYSHIIFPSSQFIWSPLPNHGLNGTVNALTMVGDDLYAGGVFTQSQDGNVKNLNRIARLAPTWTSFLPFVKK